jgi:transcriptional regulator with XRE-family HTH domain
MKRRRSFNSKKFSSTLAMFASGRPLREMSREIGGVSASTLSRISRGERPDIETFGRICRWLRVPEGVFFDHD